MFEDREKILLAHSEEFQELLASDEVLKDLRRMKTDRKAECLILASIACGCAQWISGSRASGVLTPALWSFLWTLGNAYTEDLEKITEKDTALFLYLLETGHLDFSPEEIALLPSRAGAYCRERKVDYPEAAALLIRMICRTFRILEVLPSVREDVQDEAEFDLYWLTALGSAAVAESGHSLSRILFGMPLSFCFYCFINHLKKQDRRGVIRRRSGKETVTLMMERIRFLGREFQNRQSGKAETQ